MIRKVTILAIAALMTACVTGPKFSTIKSTLPTQAEGTARIYFYRTNHFGGAYQPVVYVNKEPYGRAFLEGVFFKDVPPGKYEITTAMSQGRQVDLQLAANEVAYVRFQFRIGFAVYPLQVPAEEGAVEIQKMAYIAHPNESQ